jgi:hypothetical protein
MARPSKHDGVVYRRDDSKIWWMRYWDKSGGRHLESTGTEDWDEAQRRLRERLQARDNRTLEVVRRANNSRFRIGRIPLWRITRSRRSVLRRPMKQMSGQ